MRRVIAPTLAILAVAALVGSALPAAADVTSQDVEAARRRLREVSVELESEVARYEAVVVEEQDLRLRLDQIILDLTARERDLVLARRSARERVAEMYMAAGSQQATVTALLAYEEFGDVPARLAYLDTVAATDRDVVNRLEAARRDFLRQQELLEETLDRQNLVRAEMEALIDRIYVRLDEANAQYQEVKAEWDAQEAERIRREEEERRRRERELFLATSTTTTTTVPPTTAPQTATTSTVAVTTTGSGADATTTTSTVASTTIFAVLQEQSSVFIRASVGGCQTESPQARR